MRSAKWTWPLVLLLDVPEIYQLLELPLNSGRSTRWPRAWNTFFMPAAVVQDLQWLCGTFLVSSSMATSMLGCGSPEARSLNTAGFRQGHNLLEKQALRWRLDPTAPVLSFRDAFKRVLPLERFRGGRAPGRP